MLQGLLGTQPQAQQQGNLLGNLFQTPQQARNQSRNRLFENAIAISQTPGAGSAIAGGLLGEAAGRAMGRVTPEEDRAMQLQGLQDRLAQQGLDPSQDPYGFFTGLASELNNMGMQGEAVQAMMQAREFATDPVEMKPATFYNPETDQYVQGAYTPQGVPIDTATGQPLGQGFVESDYESPTQRETFTPLGPEEKQALGIDADKFAQRNDLTGRVHTASGQTINVGDQANPAFDALTDQFKNDLTQASEAATQATGLLEEVNRATNLLSQGDFTTGSVRPVLTGLRGIAEDLGVSIDPALREAGVENLGDVSDAQSFAAFSANLTTRLAERLPGNLNQQEINLISSASSQLGKTPEANASALAAFRAGAELAQRNASRLTEAAAQGTQELIAEQRRQRERGTEEFETLSERYKQEILEQRRGSNTQNGTVDWSDM